MNSNFTSKQLDRRAATIIRGIRTRQVTPDSDAISELAELVETTRDQPVKPAVVARLTVTRALGVKTIIEVCEDATFNSYYRFFTQQGNRRSTKKLVRTANRNEGLRPYFQAYRMTPGMEKLAELWQQHPGVTTVTVRIISRRAYKRLITARPNELGLTQTSAQLPRPSFCPSGSLKSARHA
jgi:hypothetical protein